MGSIAKPGSTKTTAKRKLDCSLRLADAHRRREVVVAIGISDGGRPFPRVGKGPITT